MRINLRDKPPIYTMVFNKHNGYYEHMVYMSNDDLKIDYLDSTYSL